MNSCLRFIFSLCFGFFSLSCTSAQIDSTHISYIGDIRAIIHDKCSHCHSSNNIAPFKLSTYHDAKVHADMIGYVVGNGTMPPWRADLTRDTFIGENKLTVQEIAKIQEWVQAGAPYGDTTLQEIPYEIPTELSPGKPSMTLHPLKHFILPATKDDYYVTYYFPLHNKTTLYISAFEMKPGNLKIVHHAWAYAIEDSSFKRPKNLRSGDVMSQEVNEFLTDASLDASYYNIPLYTPGNFTYPYPVGYAEVLKPNTVFVLQIHYSGSGKQEVDSTIVNLYFAKQPVRRKIEEFTMHEGYIQNPPFLLKPEEKKTFIMAMRGFQSDIMLFGISPHMHFRGKTVRAFAVTPSKDTINLISISDWNFKWQGIYKYAKPIIIPAHSNIYSLQSMDNTSANPNNPFNPPKAVHWGLKSIDEMCQMLLYYSYYQKGDEKGFEKR